MPVETAAPVKSKMDRIIEFLGTEEGKDAKTADLAERFTADPGTVARARKRFEEIRTRGVEREISLDALCFDHPTQMRPGEDPNFVAELVPGMLAGTYDPIGVVETPEGELVPWDGHHRAAAAADAGLSTIRALVRPGTVAEAIRLAAGANALHGLRRCPQTRRRAVLALLSDPAWAKSSTKWIAETARVGQEFAERVRREFEAENGAPATRVGKDGVERPARMPGPGSAGPEEPDDFPAGKSPRTSRPGSPVESNGHAEPSAPKESDLQREQREALEFARGLPLYGRLAPGLRSRFVADLWGYFRLMDARSAMSKAVREAERFLGLAGGTKGSPGPYLAHIGHTARLGAPKEGDGEPGWQGCSACLRDGQHTGTTSGNNVCPSCNGAGYQVTGLGR